MPSYAELWALNDGSQTLPFARLADRVDLIIGQQNRDKLTYGTAFEHVRANIQNATVHESKDQGHLAHIHAPEARFADRQFSPRHGSPDLVEHVERDLTRVAV